MALENILKTKSKERKTLEYLDKLDDLDKKFIHWFFNHGTEPPNISLSDIDSALYDFTCIEENVISGYRFITVKQIIEESEKLVDWLSYNNNGGKKAPAFCDEKHLKMREKLKQEYQSVHSQIEAVEKEFDVITKELNYNIFKSKYSIERLYGTLRDLYDSGIRALDKLYGEIHMFI